MPKRGYFIVIEGTDGSGKGTQSRLLVNALRRAGKRVEYFDFPQYGKPSARLVEMYLNGAYGLASAVGAYDASYFYAVDRFEAAPKIRQAIADGKVVVANRFTWSNAAHQGGKLKTIREKRKYWEWLFRLEFQLLDIPWPDLTLLLHVPAVAAQKLVDKKIRRKYLKTDTKRDIHENDIKHLQDAERTYLELAKIHQVPLVECVEGGKLLTPREVHSKVWNIVKKKLK